MKAVSKSTCLFTLCTAVALTYSSVEAQQTRPATRRPATPRVSSTAPSETRTAATQGRRVGPVAVVDISKIFKDHAGFKATMERMKKEVQAYEETLRARHQALAKKQEELSQFKPGSQQYITLERAIADEMAKLSVDTQMKKKEFLEREARVYFQVYTEVTTAIAEYARMYGVSLVLRYNGEEIQPDDRNSVLAGVNRAIVYQNSLDITAEISDRVNRVARAPARPPQRGQTR